MSLTLDFVDILFVMSDVILPSKGGDVFRLSTVVYYKERRILPTENPSKSGISARELSEMRSSRRHS